MFSYCLPKFISGLRLSLEKSLSKPPVSKSFEDHTLRDSTTLLVFATIIYFVFEIIILHNFSLPFPLSDPSIHRILISFQLTSSFVINHVITWIYAHTYIHMYRNIYIYIQYIYIIKYCLLSLYVTYTYVFRTVII